MKLLIYQSELAVKSVLRRPKLFVLTLVSIACTMFVPLIMTAAVDSLYTRSKRLDERYPPGSTAAILTTEKLTAPSELFSDFDGRVAVSANFTSEYLLAYSKDGELIARFDDVIALDAVGAELLCPELLHGIFDDFGCVLDSVSAKRLGIGLGDTLIIRGIDYTLRAITCEQSSFVAVGYDTLSSGEYTHTLYFIPEGSSVPTDTELRKYVKAATDSRPDLVPLDELSRSKAENTREYLNLLMLIFALFLICGLVNLARTKRGELELHKDEQAISLAVGCTRGELVIGELLSNLLTLPPALALDCAVFALIDRFCVIFPFPVKLTPTVLISLTLLMLAVLTAVSVLTVKRPAATPLAQLLKEG